MLGSKGSVKRVAVLGLGKKDKDKEGASLTPAALEAVGAQVGASAIRRQQQYVSRSGRGFWPTCLKDRILLLKAFQLSFSACNTRSEVRDRNGR